MIVTAKPQLARWLPESAAVHITDVTPVENKDPDDGVQVVWIGVVPPDVVGGLHVIEVGWPNNESPVCPAGHAISSVAGRVGGCGVGADGEPEHCAANTERLSTTSRDRQARFGRTLAM